MSKRLTHFLFGLALVAGPAAIALGEEGQPAAVKKLVVEVKVVEIATTKLRNLGFDWAQLSSGGGKQESIEKILRSAPADQLVGFLEALRQNSLARVLAEPTIATLDGRPASFAAGETQLDIVPIVLGDGRVRLEYRIELAPQQKEQPRTASRRETTAKPTTLRLDAAADLDLGKTTVVGRTKTNTQTSDGKIQESETLVFVRVDLWKPDAFTVVERPGTTVELSAAARKP